MKAETKHTPGPWRVTVKGSGIGIVASANKDNPHGQHIAHMSSGPGRSPLANATLIAAAPELAAALAAILRELGPVSCVNGTCHHDDEAPGQQAAICRAARAALRKAGCL